MKKITFFALLCALFVAPFANAQEVTKVEDPSQGYLQNGLKDNWFVSAQIGGNMLISPNDGKISLLKRFFTAPKIEVYAGKWFSQMIGLRGGVYASRWKGATQAGGRWQRGAISDEKGFYNQVTYNAGLTGDILINASNIFCGYDADRKYNAIPYAGVSFNMPFTRDGIKPDFHRPTYLGLRLGLLNTYAINDKFDVLLDVRITGNQTVMETDNYSGTFDVLVGAAYKFGKQTWSVPIVPVCPEYKYTDSEGDALVARLQQADAKIATVEQQVRDCVQTSKETAEAAALEAASEAPLATIYFPIGSAKVTSVQAKIVKAVANVMKNTDEKYVLTGWADNYTGSAKFNEKLRAKRAESVKKMIVRAGVKADRLETTTNNNNLTTYGAKSASLDRAVTINVAK